MSGWHFADKHSEENVGDHYRATNNITFRGILPSDQIPGPTQSRTIMQAQLKHLKVFRKYCRYMPFILNWTGSKKNSTPEQAKL